MCGPLFTRGRGTNFPIVFSAHKIMETKEDWARTAQETEGNFIPGSTHRDGERRKEGVGGAGIPVAWQEAAAYDLAAGRVKVKRWPASSSRPLPAAANCPNCPNCLPPTSWAA